MARGVGIAVTSKVSGRCVNCLVLFHFKSPLLNSLSNRMCLEKRRIAQWEGRKGHSCHLAIAYVLHLNFIISYFSLYHTLVKQYLLCLGQLEVEIRIDMLPVRPRPPRHFR